jgi:hypothetical protein
MLFAGLSLQGLELGFSEADVLVFGELVAAYQIVPFNNDVTHGAVVAVTDSIATLGMKPIERDVLVLSRGVDPNGDGN